MELTDKQLVKVAHTIRDQLWCLRLHRYREVKRLVYVLGDGLGQLQKDHQWLEYGINRDWIFAAAKLTERIERQLRDLPYSIEETQRMIATARTEIPPIKQIAEELTQLQDEFARVEFNRQDPSISVFTDPIELEGVYLGDFEIKLEISQFSQMRDNSVFRIVALDPHPAACNDMVTHPHVSEEYLCAGDATIPMQAALSNGRICDAFLLVKSVLETYNPSSPYVSLDEWYGISCYDCGYITNEEDSYYCETCEHTVCGECFSYCRSCETSSCRGCMSDCQFCEEPTCESCLNSCSKCDEKVCTSCVKDSFCPTCKEEMENQENENETNEPENTDKEKEQRVA